MISQLEDTCKTIEVSQDAMGVKPRPSSCGSWLPQRHTGNPHCNILISPEENGLLPASHPLAQEEKTLPYESTRQILSRVLGFFTYIILSWSTPFVRVAVRKTIPNNENECCSPS